MGRSESLESTGGSAAVTEQELYRRLEQQAAVAELGRRALTGAAVAELLADAVEATAAALGTERVALLLPDEAGTALRCHVNVGWAPEDVRPVPLDSSSMLAFTFASLEPVVVPDLEREERFAGSRHLLELGIVSALSVAIRGAERPVGVLVAHSRTRRSFSEDDVYFVRGIANVLAAAVANADADAARRASEARLAFLAEASDALAGSLDPVETLEALASLVVPRLADWCIVHLDDEGLLVPAAIRHRDPAVEAAARAAALERPLDMEMTSGPPYVLRTGESVLASEVSPSLIDASTRDEAQRRRMHALGMRSAINVPLAARGSVLGVVSLVSTSPERCYGPEDLALAEELGRRAAVAVDNARLHEAARDARERAERLQRVAARLARALTPAEVTDVVLSIGIEATGAEAALIALVAPGGDVVRVAAGRGYPPGALAGWDEFSLADEVPVSVAVRTGEPVFLVDRGERDARFPALADLRPGTHALVTLPLAASAEPVGALVLSFGAERRFADEDRDFLQALASQCAQALDRAGLYERLAVQREQLESVLRQLPSGVVIVEASGRVLLSNDRLERILGRPPGAWADDAPIARALATGEKVAAEDVELARADGTTAFVRIGAAPVRDEHGRIAAAVAVVHDVTEEVAARHEAERRADAARALAFVADGVALLDPAGVVRLWNDAAARITRLPADRVVGLRLEEVVPGWRDLAARLPRSQGRPLTLPLELGGDERWLSISAVAFPGGTVYAFRDVTEEHALEQMKSDFIATVSHELRTPLAAVYGGAETLRHRPDLGEPDRLRFLTMIADQAGRLSRIVEEILLASRLDARALPLELGAVDAAEVAGQVVDVIRRTAPDGFEIGLDAPAGLPPAVADADRLRQALANLLENAVKYAGESARAELALSAGGGRVRFAVRDAGIGIPAADRERIFEKFYRVDAAMTSGVSGTGLGLYIVRELVERMGGAIAVESEVGRGSVFTIELPAA